MSLDSKVLRIAIAFAFPCVTLVCAHLLFDPVYRTNDDPSMLLIAAGETLADGPDPYLVFSNHLWGSLVAWLYSWLPAVPWYRLLQLAVQVGANATLVYVALGKRVTPGRLLPIAGYFLVFDMLMSARPHFTLTASIAGIAAVALSWDRSSGRDRLGATRWTLFVVLWAVSAAIRHESAVLVYLLSAPAALIPMVHAWRTGNLRSALRGVAAPMLVAAAIIASFHGYNRVRYNAPDWRDFTATASSMGAILDFGAADSSQLGTWVRFPDGTLWLDEVRHAPEIYLAARTGPGWTENELHMLMEWFYADPELFSLDRISQFLDQVGQPPVSGARPFAGLRADPSLYLLIVALAIGLSSRRFDRQDAARLLLLAIAGLGVMTYVDFNLHRLVSWVYEPVFAFLGWSVLILGRERPLVLGDRLWFVTRAVAMAILIVFLIPVGEGIARESAITTVHRKAFTEAVERLSRGPDHLYVSWASSFPQELLGPFDGLEPFRDLEFYALGGATRGGHNRKLLQRFGITDIHRAIYEDPRVRVISQPRQNRVLEGFIQERYGVEIEAQQVESFSTGGASVVRRVPFLSGSGCRVIYMRLQTICV